MADWFPALDPQHIEFIRAQHVFFVATASADGYPNLSPKGYDSLDVLTPSTLVFIDLPGSGNQTASHILGGSPVTLMFASFSTQSRILRVYGRGQVHPRGTSGFSSLLDRIRPGIVGPYTRQLIAIQVEKVQTSCGYGVPRYEYLGDRDTLIKYYERATSAGEFEVKLARWTRPQDPV